MAGTGRRYRRGWRYRVLALLVPNYPAWGLPPHPPTPAMRAPCPSVFWPLPCGQARVTSDRSLVRGPRIASHSNGAFRSRPGRMLGPRTGPVLTHPCPPRSGNRCQRRKASGRAVVVWGLTMPPWTVRHSFGMDASCLISRTLFGICRHFGRPVEQGMASLGSSFEPPHLRAVRGLIVAVCAETGRERRNHQGSCAAVCVCVDAYVFMVF